VKRSRDYREGLLEDLRSDPEMRKHYLQAAKEESEEVYQQALRDVSEACGEEGS